LERSVEQVELAVTDLDHAIVQVLFQVGEVGLLELAADRAQEVVVRVDGDLRVSSPTSTVA
jgi:hypothetical protein